MKKYLIDSNSLISPHRTFYPFDLLPSFWTTFKQSYDRSVFLLDKVRDELCWAKGDKKDRLQLWVEENCLTKGKVIFPNADAAVLAEYELIINYIRDSGVYTQKSYDQWMSFEKADPWLIAAAKAHNYSIVTMETRNTNLNTGNPTSKEPRIPDVCDALGVECIDLFTFMRELQFVI